MHEIDVCLAMFNGKNYVESQIYSIYNNNSKYYCRLNIVDDFSSDQCFEFVTSKFSNYMPFALRIWRNIYNSGHSKAFSSAISKSSFPYIMLSDQDDIWPIGRIDFLMSFLLQSRSLLVVGNFNEHLFFTDTFKPHNFSIISPIVSKTNRITLSDYVFSKVPLYGCCFAFSSELVKYILPIPSWVESHDRWIALIAILKRKAVFIDVAVTIRGIHSTNQTNSTRPIYLKIRSFAIKLISIPWVAARIIRIDFFN